MDVELFTADEWRRLAQRFGLTPRQLEVAKLICAAGSYKSIGSDLGISMNTVRLHMRGLFEKLAAHDRVEVIIRLICANREMDGQPGN